jgi:hypothetical protein
LQVVLVLVEIHFKFANCSFQNQNSQRKNVYQNFRSGGQTRLDFFIWILQTWPH